MCEDEGGLREDSGRQREMWREWEAERERCSCGKEWEAVGDVAVGDVAVGGSERCGCGRQ